MFTNLISARRATQLSVAAATLALVSAGIASACHPQGVILKDVQNVTTGSALSKADTAATAVTARPGDTLVYHITVKNQATGNQDQMIKTVITDALPAGLELVKQDNFNIGQIDMKKSAERTITVKVTAKTAGIIKNQACFTGDSTDHKVPQKGCDLAYVNVVVPSPTPTPTPTPTPSKSPTPTPTPTVTPTPTPSGKGEALGTATVLPETGAPVGASALALSAMLGSGYLYIKSRKR